jgi:hypothetical protein
MKPIRVCLSPGQGPRLARHVWVRLLAFTAVLAAAALPALAASGLKAVAHDSTLTGDGTDAAPLEVAPGGVNTAQLASNAVQAANVASGQVVKSVNGLHDDLTLAAGSTISITPSGSTLTIGAAGLTLPFAGSTNGTELAHFGVANYGTAYGSMASTRASASW